MKKLPRRAPIAPQSIESFEARLLKARSLLKSIGHILSLYSSGIRAIMSASSVLKTEEQDQINFFAWKSVGTPISLSPTLSQSFQYAISELYPKQYKTICEQGKPKIRDVLKLMDANELAAVLGITYFYKLLNKSIDQDESAKIAPLISSQLRNGAIIGAQLGSSFGRGGGIAACGLRYLGLACLIKANIKAFKNLRRLIDDSGSLDHSNFELENFGFTHLDVASVLAGDLGFGPTAREAFIIYQSEKVKPSSPLGVFWNHTLVETTKIWQSKGGADNIPKNKKAAIGSLDSVDGYKWLWQQGDSNEILPGIDTNEIQSLLEPATIAVSEEPDFVPCTDKINILIVEDEEISARMLSQTLGKAGNICICRDAEAAASLLNKSADKLPFELIFLDIKLPGMSGLDFLNYLRQLEKTRKVDEEESALVFMITGDETPHSVVQSFSNGANGYITKPFKREEIREELAKFNLILDPEP